MKTCKKACASKPIFVMVGSRRFPDVSLRPFPENLDNLYASASTHLDSSAKIPEIKNMRFR